MKKRKTTRKNRDMQQNNDGDHPRNGYNSRNVNSRNSSTESANNMISYYQDPTVLTSEQINNIKNGRDSIANFYDTTEDTPMKLRILMFRQ
jgi:hypothetical protein